MTDEEIEKAKAHHASDKPCYDHNTYSEDCPLYKDRGDICNVVFELYERINRLESKIKRLSEDYEDMYNQTHNLQLYIDNHEEIWKRNAEIDKVVVRKETAKEILQFIKYVQAMFYDKEYIAIQKIIAEKYGIEVD